MKLIPLPQQLDGTPSEKLDRLFRAVIAVPKMVIDREEAKWKRRKKRVKKNI